jgi:hypothetical protein
MKWTTLKKLFVRLIFWDLSELRDPTSSYAAAGIGPNFNGARSSPRPV